jgi:hypothetical protein
VAEAPGHDGRPERQDRGAVDADRRRWRLGALHAGSLRPAGAPVSLFASNRGRVTYTRVGPDWFVVPGLVGDRIVYQRTVLSRGGRLVNTRYVSDPRAMKDQLDAAVTLMSRSFRPG